ncbi:MAG: hypothetical protein RIS59_5, partial [Pseudomonadota bacterium]
MTVFILFAALATLLVAALLWFAQRARETRLPDDAEAGWAVMIARRREIEDDPAIDPALREALIAEWQEQAAAMPQSSGQTSTPMTSRRHLWLPLGVVAVAVAAYALVGDVSEPAMRVNLTNVGAPSALARETPPRPGEN